MYKASVTVDEDILLDIQQATNRMPGLMNTAYRRNIGRLRRRVLERLRTYPGRPRYPLRWKSDRQRRFVMAKLRAENNLPYQRTGTLAAGWRVVLDNEEGSGVLQAENNVPYTRFVQGNDVQPFHLDTGWTQAANVIADARVEAEEVLIQTWYTVVDGSVS